MSAIGISLKLPLQHNATDGHYGLLKNGIEMANQNLKMLFLTSPGERIMDIEFGIGIRQYLFEPNLEIILDAIQRRIEQQVQKYLPYITIQELNLGRNEEGNLAKINLLYSIKGNNSINKFILSL